MSDLEPIRLERPRPGDGVCLLHGLGPLGLAPESLPTPPRAALRILDVAPSKSGGVGFGDLRISFHADWQAVIEAASPFGVVPQLFDGEGFCISPSRLRDGAESEQGRAFEAFFGVPCGGDDTYLLLQLPRRCGRLEHEVTAEPTRVFFDRMWHLLPAWRKASVRLQPGQRIHDGCHHDARVGARRAQRYVEAFYEYGTHFVSGVDLGDTLLQLVVLPRDVFGRAQAEWTRMGEGRPVCGRDVQLFAPLLGSGSARQVGPIVSLARDPALQGSISAGDWEVPGRRHRPSLLASLDPSCLARARARLQADNPVAIQLCPMSRFMEYFRAINHERILRGALLQRWGDRVELPIRRMPSVAARLAKRLIPPRAPQPFGDSSPLLHGDRLEEADWRKQGSTLSVCVRVVELTGRYRRLLGRGSSLATGLFAAATHSREAPVLELSLDDFGGALWCSSMSGVAVLRCGNRSEVVVDGLRFADDEPQRDRLPRVRVRADLHTPDPAAAVRALPAIEDALYDVATGLAQAGPDPWTRNELSGWARFLANTLAVMPSRGPDARLETAYVRALYLSRPGAWMPATATHADGRVRSMVLGKLYSLAAIVERAQASIDGMHERARARAGMPSPNHCAAGAALDGADARDLASLRTARRAVEGEYLALLHGVLLARDNAAADAARCTRLRRMELSAQVELARAASSAMDDTHNLCLEGLAAAAAGRGAPLPDEVLRARCGDVRSDGLFSLLQHEITYGFHRAQLDEMERACTEAQAGLPLAKLVDVLRSLPENPCCAPELLAASRATAGLATDWPDGNHGGGALSSLQRSWERFDSTRRALHLSRYHSYILRLEMGFLRATMAGGNWEREQMTALVASTLLEPEVWADVRVEQTRMLCVIAGACGRTLSLSPTPANARRMEPPHVLGAAAALLRQLALQLQASAGFPNTGEQQVLG